MFDNNIKTEPIPERVFELCKLVSKGDIDDKLAKEKMEPKSLNSSGTSYYGSIREVCVQELQLVSKEGNMLSFIGDKKVLKDMDSFRKYCNSIVYKNNDTYFCKLLSCYLESNDEWLKYTTLTNSNLRTNIQEQSGIALVTEQMMLGMRFWVSFLGYGIIQESNAMYYLPNMHVALQDFCELAELEKDKEYTIEEFVNELMKYASVALNKSKDTKKFNLAMSNALRQMHDREEIMLERVSDSKETWNLFEDKTHEFTDKITHLVYKGVKRE